MGAYCVVVEDEVGIRDLVAHTLRSLGIDAEGCASTDELGLLLEQRTPVLVLLDIALARSDAVSGLRMLAGVGYKGPVQLVSGRDPGIVESVRSVGADLGLSMLDPILKPFRPSQIRQLAKDCGMVVDAHVAASDAADSFSAVRGVELWAQPLSDMRGALEHFEICLKERRRDWGQSVMIRDYAPTDAAEVLETIKFVSQHKDEAKRALSACEKPFSFVVPVRNDALQRLNLPSVFHDLSGAANIAPSITFCLDEQDVLSDVERSRQTMLQLRIIGADVRVTEATSRFVSIAGHRPLPVQQVEFVDSILFRNGGVLPQLSHVVDVVHRANCRVVVRRPPSWATETLATAGVDLRESPGTTGPVPLQEAQTRWAGPQRMPSLRARRQLDVHI